MANSFTITNFQNSFISGSLNSQGKHLPKTLTHHNITYQINQIKCVFSDQVKSIQDSYAKLQHEVTRLAQSKDSHGFEVILHEGNVTIVFDKSRAKAKKFGEMLGLVVFLSGCLSASYGKKRLSATLIAAGSAGFYDAHCKNIVEFNTLEYLKQASLGVVSTALSNKFCSLFSPVKTLSDKITKVACVSLFGYLISSILNQRKTSVRSGTAALISAIVSTLVSHHADNVISLKNVRYEVFAKYFLMKAGFVSSISSAASKITENFIMKKPWSERLGISTATGIASGVSSAIPEAYQTQEAMIAAANLQNLQREHQQKNESAKSRYNTLINSAAQSKQSIIDMRSREFDIWADDLKKGLTNGCYINSKYEKSPEKDIDANLESFRKRYINGESLSFKPRNSCTTTRIGNSAQALTDNFTDQIKYGLRHGFYLNGEWVHAPRKNVDGKFEEIKQQYHNGKTFTYRFKGEKDTIHLSKSANSPNTYLNDTIASKAIQQRNELITEINSHLDRVPETTTIEVQIPNIPKVKQPPLPTISESERQTDNHVETIKAPKFSSKSEIKKRKILEAQRDELSNDIRRFTSEIQELKQSRDEGTKKEKRRIKNQIAELEKKVQVLMAKLKEKIKDISTLVQDG